MGFYRRKKQTWFYFAILIILALATFNFLSSSWALIK